MSFLKLTNTNPVEFSRSVQDIRKVTETKEVQTPEGPQEVSVSMASLSPQERFDDFDWAEEIVAFKVVDAVPQLERVVLDASSRVLNGIRVEVNEMKVDREMEEARALVLETLAARYFVSYEGGTNVEVDTGLFYDVPTANGPMANYVIDDYGNKTAMVAGAGAGNPYQTGAVILTDLWKNPIQLNPARLEQALLGIYVHRDAARSTFVGKYQAIQAAASKADLQAVLDDLDNGWPPAPALPA